ncbi:ribonuclease D [Rhodoligotrophos appendicifer]|uniref:ribonuclease D n=1 Tax=Rhodoligotrophos appendicifer TaxID=987056 RepID=UPI0011868AC5|nr:ribonuclease D [Rhodoligotrophos appendicifer]
MEIISTTEQLNAVCADLATDAFVTVDTEFMRETTFWPQLCLIQIAGAERAVIIDPLAPGLDLAPFFNLMNDAKILKVFHAARQDIEIVVHRAGIVPHPVFDTQVAAMVCGFGEQVGYESIVRKLAGATIDKSSRFTDWSRRPLTDKQLRYALADVTHLRQVYSRLKTELDKSGRESWLEEEMATLTSPDTYRTDPKEAWRRLKFRARDKKSLAVFIEVAAWREREAQERNVPRSRILKDDVLAEIAVHAPKSSEDLKMLRAVPRGFSDSKMGAEVVSAVARGLKADLSLMPRLEDVPFRENGGALGDILRLALKVISQSEGVAPKLIASSSDLDAIAANDDADVPALHGWRRDLFGNVALGIKRGQLSIVYEAGEVRIIGRNRATARRALETATTTP